MALAIRAVPTGQVLVLYDPYSLDIPIPRTIRATAVVREYRPEYWIVGSIFAQHGYGPLLYAVAAEIADANGALLIPSESRVKASKATWEKFAQNPFVDIVKLADELGANGPYNMSPTGFGIKGNGTLDLHTAVRRDHEAIKQQGAKWHEAMIDVAYKQMLKRTNG